MIGKEGKPTVDCTTVVKDATGQPQKVDVSLPPMHGEKWKWFTLEKRGKHFEEFDIGELIEKEVGMECATLEEYIRKMPPVGPNIVPTKKAKEHKTAELLALQQEQKHAVMRPGTST